MAEYIVEINQDNSLDLPLEVRDRLALKPGDKMLLSLDNTEEHMIVGKLPMESMEKAQEIHNVLGTRIDIPGKPE